MKLIIVAVALTLTLTGIAFAQSNEQCAANVTHTGGGIFLSAGTVNSHEDLPAVAPKDAFKSVYRALVAAGWTIASADGSLGVITATKPENNLFGAMNGSADHSRSLNIQIDNSGAGSNISVTSNLLSGHAYSKGDYVHFVCDPIASLNGPPTR